MNTAYPAVGFPAGVMNAYRHKGAGRGSDGGGWDLEAVKWIQTDEEGHTATTNPPMTI